MKVAQIKKALQQQNIDLRQMAVELLGQIERLENLCDQQQREQVAMSKTVAQLQQSLISLTTAHNNHTHRFATTTAEKKSVLVNCSVVPAPPHGKQMLNAIGMKAAGIPLGSAVFLSGPKR